MKKPLRVVLDTNPVLSALVFSGGKMGALRLAWQSGRILPLVSRPTTVELIRVLGYPKFQLTPEDQQDLLADYLPWCDTVDIPHPVPAVPKCRDTFDLPFLHLAAAGNADLLATGDEDLLQIKERFSCPIVTATALLAQIA